MHAFSVAPFDQNLSIDGKILTDDCATLGTLGVIPESVILLKVRNSFPTWGILQGFGDEHPCVNVCSGGYGGLRSSSRCNNKWQLGICAGFCVLQLWLSHGDLEEVTASLGLVGFS